jgi:hypothetical protein
VLALPPLKYLKDQSGFATLEDDSAISCVDEAGWHLEASVL